MTPLEIWAGPECTVNRVGDSFRDQLVETGFADRLDDLDRLASLGVARIRFPLLWERCHAGDDFDWRWADERVARLRELKLPFIAGLVHHGSGPPHTSLLSDDFAEGVARFARAAAERYPHIDAWTPVNEPLTTARFAALYGVWYPHHREDRSFVRALLNQVRATVLAMRAVREVNPSAMLVQTDDLGFTHAMPRLQYQASFENERRWLSFDLLCGRVDRRHRMWRYLRRHGASEEELLALVDAPCPPDIVGINHYVTSERFLDDRLENYPRRMHGGNRRHRYVDTETVRVHGPLIGGIKARLREACERYRRPVALTECHLGCTREEQLRWLVQARQSMNELRQEGFDVRALTAWAAFGTQDWDTLVTHHDGRYEPGMWDVRSDPPRPTALAGAVREMAQGRMPTHPAAEGSGWWQRSLRFLYSTQGEPQTIAMSGRPLLIAGATGTLGRAFAHLCHMRGLPYRLLHRADMDIAEAASVEAAIARWRPWAIVNAAGFVRVDDAEQQPRQWRENMLGPATLAAMCARHGVKLLSFSSDLVFDGSKEGAYVESDAPRPLNAYGEAKAEAERRVLHASPEALVVRTAAFFGPWDRYNFLTIGLAALQRGERWQAASDQVVTPTYVRDLVMCSLDLLIDGESGIWHLANQGSASWSELAIMAATAAGLDTSLIDAVPASTLGQLAARPAKVVLGSERGRIMPTLDDALSRYLVEMEEDVLPEEESDGEPDSLRLVA